LLTPPRTPDPGVAARPIRRNGLTMWPLNHVGSTNRLQTYKVHIPASPRRRPATLPVHDGHDWTYVLSGRLRLLLGDEDLAVEPDTAVEFLTSTPHWFGAIDGAVDILAMFGPHGAPTSTRRLHRESADPRPRCCPSTRRQAQTHHASRPSGSRGASGASIRRGRSDRGS
jgi:hypothetical protein